MTTLVTVGNFTVALDVHWAVSVPQRHVPSAEAVAVIVFTMSACPQNVSSYGTVLLSHTVWPGATPGNVLSIPRTGSTIRIVTGVAVVLVFVPHRLYTTQA